MYAIRSYYDPLVVYAGEGHHGGAPSFRSEEREGLGLLPFQNGRLGYGLGGHDRPLPASSMEPDLIHVDQKEKGIWTYMKTTMPF